MSFPSKIREEALVSAARHCCVCHRYAGVKVEVHHIIPEGAGGDDSSENAIPLCFDCHADAGHYNPGHPRGTRFSPSELARARDEWYRLVQAGAVTLAADPNIIYARHLICRSWEVVQEICRMDLARLPVLRPRLWENDVLRFLRQLVGRSRATRTFVATHDSLETFAAKYRIGPERRSGGEPVVTEVVRPLAREEAQDLIKASDWLTHQLLAEGAAAEDVVRDYAYFEQCGASSFHEVAETRPLWASFLAIENATDRPIILSDAVIVESGGRGLGYRTFRSPGSQAATELPPIPLEPGANAVFPECVLVEPLQVVGLVAGHRAEHRYRLDAGRLVA